MRTRLLGKVLLQASLLAVPATGCCWMGDDHGTAHVFATRAEHGAQIDTCLADETQCGPLCFAVFDDPTGLKDIDGCEVAEIHADGVDLDIHWTEICEAPRRGSRAPPRSRRRRSPRSCGWSAR